MNPRSDSTLVLVSMTLLVLSFGCQEPPLPDITFHLRSLEDLKRLDRVVFVELTEEGDASDYSRDMTRALVQEIQGRRLFHLDILPWDNPICDELVLNDNAGFTMRELSDIRKALRCDAVIVGQVRDFRPHPHTKAGLYLRMIDLKNGWLVWGVDHVWDTSEQQTARRIRRFFDKRMRSGGYEPADWELAVLSPRIFAKFVAYETALTLPDRTSVNKQE